MDYGIPFGAINLLAGRGRECEILYGLIDRVRGRRSAAVVVRGEAGVGKTALLDDAVRAAPDLRVARALGVQSEMELPLAALHQLCWPMLDHLERVPGPQRDALATTFGLRAGPAPNRFLVGLAVLSLLCEVAGERPLLCVLDDAQWLDRESAQALAFAARRLLADSLLIVFATRAAAEELNGLPELVVEGLNDVDARELLHTAAPWPVDERVLDRIVAETRGNPLALLELPRGLSPVELAGGFVRPDALPLPGRIEESVRRQTDRLPDDTRLLLVVAAADPVGDPALIWRAVNRMGLSAQAADDAAAAGLIDIGAQVVFHHPLVRSAVYRAASPTDRHRAHAALAEVTNPETDPDRRAWHRAQATAGTDEDVAAELERSANRAQRRGGLAAASAFLERTVTLTVDPARRAQRALIAAEAKNLAGAPNLALRLLATAEAGPPTSSTGPRSIYCGPKSGIRRVVVAMRRCCCGSPSDSRRSIRNWPAKHISMRCPRCASPGNRHPAAVCVTLDRPHWPPPNRRSSGPATSCSTGWQPPRSPGSRPGRRC